MSNHGKEILAQAKALRELLKDNKKNMSKVHARREEIEEEVLDIYHIIELEKKPNAARRMLLFSELVKVLKERRDTKDTYHMARLIQNTVTSGGNQALNGKLGELISNIDAEFKRQEVRKYKPRRRFDLFDPNADYVQVTPEYQAWLDAQEAEENARLEEYHAETTSEGLDEIVDGRTQEQKEEDAQAIIQEFVEEFGIKVEDIPVLPTGEDKTGDEIVKEEILESTNLVYSTPVEEDEKEEGTLWQSVLSKISFKNKKKK